MKIGNLFNKAKLKAQAISDKIASHPSVRFVKRKEAQLAKKFDSMPKKAACALSVIPVVNLFTHYIQEKGLHNRLPELRDHSNADLKFKTYNDKVMDLLKQRKSMDKNLTDMKAKRQAFLANNQTPPKGLKAKAQKKMASWSFSPSRIRDMEKEVGKIQKKLNKLGPIVMAAGDEQKATLAKLNAVDTDGSQTAEIKQDKKDLRKAFRIGLACLLAAVVASVALGAFGVIPAAIGIGLAVVFGMSLGIHVALCKAEKWKHEGKLNLTLAKVDE